MMVLLIVGAASADFWLELVIPIPEQTEDTTAAFACPQGLESNLCNLLRAIDEENPEESLAMIQALNSDLIPAPSGETNRNSIAGDIDSTIVSVYTETLVRTGRFSEIDALHKAQGRADVWEIVADERVQRVLRFEDFEVSLGPDLRVYLSIAESPRSAAEMLGSGSAIEVGLLKGNIGAQNYILEPEIDITQYASVVIFSAPYGRVFSTAPLGQPIQ